MDNMMVSPVPPNNKPNPVKISDEDRRLPNGQKVDFGNGSSKKNKKPANKKSGKDKSKASQSNDADKEQSKIVSKSTPPSADVSDFPKEVEQTDIKGKKKKNDSAANKTKEGKEKEKSSKNKKKSNETNVPSLSNDAKPNFHNDSTISKKKFQSEQSLPNGTKPNFNSDYSESNSNKNFKKQGKSNKDKKGIPEETYAGSSFHSSPAPLNLPKPTFKSSPPQSTISLQQVSSPEVQPPPIQQPVLPIQNPVTAYLPHAPGIPPPNEPIPGPMMFKPYVQPGFSYQVSPQGYISYPYLQNGPPGQPPVQANYNLVTSHYQSSWSFPNPPPTNNFSEAENSGHKISFNELLGSAKN